MNTKQQDCPKDVEQTTLSEIDESIKQIDLQIEDVRFAEYRMHLTKFEKELKRERLRDLNAQRIRAFEIRLELQKRNGQVNQTTL